MKSIRYFIPAFFFSLLLLLSSCEFIADVFKTGMYTGIIIVILVIVLIIWLIRKIF